MREFGSNLIGSRSMAQLNLEPLPDSRFVAFFEKFGTPRSEELFRAWERETRGSRMTECYRRYKAIEIVLNVGESSVRNFFHEDPERRARLGSALQQLMALMGPELDLPTPAVSTGVRTRSIALLTENEVASVLFHYELLRILAQMSRKHGLALSLHLCSREKLEDEITNLQAFHRPEGYIFLRLTPTKDALQVLLRTATPVVLIQADLLGFEEPVLAHIVPDQSGIPSDLAGWGRRLKEMENRSTPPKVIVVAVRDEQATSFDWPPVQPGTFSIRNQRKQLVMAALKESGLQPIMEVVKDYSSHHAFEVFQRHRDADGFVCMSDSLAIAMKQFCILTERPWEGRILGFDNTPPAHLEGISSFDQSRSETARLAIEALMTFLDRKVDSPIVWPKSEVLRFPVALKLRPDPSVQTRAPAPPKARTAPGPRAAYRARTQGKRPNN